MEGNRLIGNIQKFCFILKNFEGAKSFLQKTHSNSPKAPQNVFFMMFSLTLSHQFLYFEGTNNCSVLKTAFCVIIATF